MTLTKQSPCVYLTMLICLFPPISSGPPGGKEIIGGISSLISPFSSPFSSIMNNALPSSGDKKGDKKPAKAPLWNLARRPGQSKRYDKGEVPLVPLQEVECVKSYFMSPYHHPINFSLNGSIYDRQNKFCQWNFFGTEQCIPLISCDTSRLTASCESEYLEILDGVGGEAVVCGESADQLENLQATSDLRDLYVRYKVLKGGKGSQDKTVFNCTVTCGKRGEGTPLVDTFEKKFNPKCMCGTRPNNDRIMNGEVATKFEFPWLVAIVETNTRSPFCGGSIINNRFIQTAGHCIKGKFVDYRNIQVVVNGHYFDKTPNTNVVEAGEPKTYPLDILEQLDKKNGSRRYNIEAVKVHPLYVSENNDFDIALLLLAEEIDLNPKTLGEVRDIMQQPRAICLPPVGSYLRTFAGKKALVAGWGLPDIKAEGTMTTLNKLDVKVYTPKECKEMFAFRINRRMICAGYREGGKDSCSGDSGAPLVYQERPEVWMQIGSVSFGEGCGEEDHPGVYCRETEVLQWIHFVSNYNAMGADEDEESQSATWCITPP